MIAMSKSRKPKQAEEPITATSVKFSRELAEAMSQYINAQKWPPSKNDLISRAVEKLLEAEGYWPPKPTKE